MLKLYLYYGRFSVIADQKCDCDDRVPPGEANQKNDCLSLIPALSIGATILLQNRTAGKTLKRQMNTVKRLKKELK